MSPSVASHNIGVSSLDNIAAYFAITASLVSSALTEPSGYPSSFLPLGLQIAHSIWLV